MIQKFPHWVSEKNVILFCLFLATSIGCAKIPCYPPDHYAPEPNAPYTAEEVRVSTSKAHILAGTLTVPSASSPPYPAVMMITDRESNISEVEKKSTRNGLVCSA